MSHFHSVVYLHTLLRDTAVAHYFCELNTEFRLKIDLYSSEDFDKGLEISGKCLKRKFDDFSKRCAWIRIDNPGI